MGSYFFSTPSRRRLFKNTPAVIMTMPVENRRSDSGSGVAVPTTPVPSNKPGSAPSSTINMICPPGSPVPPVKSILSTPPDEVQVALEKMLCGSDVGQSNVKPPRPVKVRSRLVKVWKVSLNTIRQPPGEGIVIGGCTRLQVEFSKVTANGAVASVMTHAAGLEKQTFAGSRTCTWKSTPDA